MSRQENFRFSLHVALMQLYSRRSKASKLARLESAIFKSNSNDELRALNAEISQMESRLMALNGMAQTQAGQAVRI